MTCSTPMLASTPMWAGESRTPAGKTSAPGAMSSPRSRTLVPAATGSSIKAQPSSDRVCSTMHTASAPPRDHRPRHDADRFTLPHLQRTGVVAGHDPADHPQPGRAVLYVAGPHGVAVHGRVGERRHRDIRANGLGQHQAQRVCSADLYR